jgi:hypothetical protein
VTPSWFPWWFSQCILYFGPTCDIYLVVLVDNPIDKRLIISRKLSSFMNLDFFALLRKLVVLLLWKRYSRIPPENLLGPPCNFFLHISFSLVELWLHTDFQLPRWPKSGRFMVWDKSCNKKFHIINGFLSPQLKLKFVLGFRLRLTKKYFDILTT